MRKNKELQETHRVHLSFLKVFKEYHYTIMTMLSVLGIGKNGEIFKNEIGLKAKEKKEY